MCLNRCSKDLEGIFVKWIKKNILGDKSTCIDHKLTLIVFLKASINSEVEPAVPKLDNLEREISRFGEGE